MTEPTVLFTHAAGLCKEVWHPVLTQLGVDVAISSAVAQFHLLDFRGHGTRAEPPSADGANWIVDAPVDVLEFADAFIAQHTTSAHTTSAVVNTAGLIGVGHSLGATALLIAELDRSVSTPTAHPRGT
jgi:pimeloyl-ACP methyl ester carboxylesterase